MYNLLLFHDGLDKRWETGKKTRPLEESNNEYEIDCDSEYDKDEFNDDVEMNIEFTLRRLSRLKLTQEVYNYT